MREPHSEGYQFGLFRLDRAERVLLCDGQRVPLARKAVELLLLLVANPGRTLSKRELMDALWPALAVHENSLPVAVHALRRALGKRAHGAPLIETVPRRGYRFVGAVAATSAPGVGPPMQNAAALAGVRDVFVGRAAELKRLLALFERTCAGRGELVFVSGEAGIGKSALVQRFLGALAARGSAARIATGRCLESYGPSEPFLPFLEALGDLLAGPHGPSLASQLAAHAPRWCSYFPALLAGGGAAAAHAHAGGREAMLRQLATALGAWSAEQPVILVLEDLHWADPSSLDLLQLSCARRGEQRLLVIGTFRPESLTVPAESGAGTERVAASLSALAAERGLPLLALPLLSHEDVGAYLQTCFPQHDFSPSLADLVLMKTEGLPLFVSRWIDTLREQGHIAERAGRAVLARELSEFERWAPDSLHSLIRHRLARLPAATQRALAFASVEGDEFRAVVLAELLAEDVLALEEELALVARRSGWIVPAGEEELPDGVVSERYRFAHVLYQNVLYEGLSSQRRCALHQQAALALDAHGAARSSRYFPELALHFERGRSYSRGVAALIAAGDHADRSLAQREALGYYARARALLDKLPESERLASSLILHHGEGWAAFGLGQLQAAVCHFEALVEHARALEAGEAQPAGLEAIDRAFAYFQSPWSETRLNRAAPIMPLQRRAHGPAALRAEGLMCLCNVLGGSRDWAALGPRARELHELAHATGNEPRRAEALAWLAAESLASGDLGDAQTALDACIELSRRLGHDRALLLALAERARLHALQCELPQAEAAYRETLELARTSAGVAEYTLALADLAARQGELSRALELHGQLSELVRSVCPDGASFAGWIHRELGDLAGAAELDAGALRALRPFFGRIELVSRLSCQLAVSQTHLGELDAAASTLEDAERQLAAQPKERSWLQGALWHAQAELALARADLTRAEALAQRSSSLARTQRAREQAAESEALLARCAVKRANLAHARAHAEAALELLGGSATPLSAWKAQALLARIAGHAGDRARAREAWERARELADGLALRLSSAPLRASFQREVARCLEAPGAPPRGAGQQHEDADFRPA
jgi:DNA-binding winged helix-turn-helix (wHTH) protein